MYGFVCFQSLLIITCNNKSTVSLLICHSKKKDFVQKVKSVCPHENVEWDTKFYNGVTHK